MPDVLVRNIDEETLDKLKARAAAHNRSLQAELKSLLEMYAGPDLEETKSRVNDIIMKYRAEDRTFSDSAGELSEERNR